MPASASYSWTDGDVFVISTLDVVEVFGEWTDVVQWHLSISCVGLRRRPNTTEVKRVLKAFDLVGAEEDNHRPGIARHFWMPVVPEKRIPCECKATEIKIVEPDGFRWQCEPDKAELVAEQERLRRLELGALF